jgi:hypothetical protein
MRLFSARLQRFASRRNKNEREKKIALDDNLAYVKRRGQLTLFSIDRIKSLVWRGLDLEYGQFSVLKQYSP